MEKTAVEWLAEKYNYVTWMRNRDEISAGLADEWRKHYLDQAKQMEREQIKGSWLSAWKDSMLNPLSDDCYEDLAEAYYKETYGK
jgi:hypothetical protein